MLSDRTYMRGGGYPKPTTSVLVWILCLVTAGFILQNIFLRWISPQAYLGLERALEFSRDGLLSGKVWTLVTYALLHDPENLLHIIGNLLGFYFLGRELLPLLGERRFLALIGAAVTFGALLWAASNWGRPGTSLIGLSAAVCALLVLFACLNPDQPITLLLFFVLPVTLRPKYLALAALILDFFGFLFFEVLGRPSPLGFAHSAHLGGMAVGWIYFKAIHAREWRSPDTASPEIELPNWFKRNAKAEVPVKTVAVNVAPKVDLKAEVDRILDKISSQGIHSLTPDERRLLDNARDVLNKR
jgi:membrane associated rhomboid family serine protease